MTSTSDIHSLPLGEVRALRGERLLRMLNRVLPLGRHYHPIFSSLNRNDSLISIPFAGMQVVVPAIWRKFATQLLLAEKGGPLPDFVFIEPILKTLKDGCLIDIGANVGLYTLMLRKSSPLPIISYEPQPFLFRLFQWNIELSRLCNVTARNAGCGEKAGEMLIAIGTNGRIVAANEQIQKAEMAGDWHQQALQTSRHLAVQVPIVTLDDDLANCRVALLKIDCEGFEHHVLLGAQRLLRRDRPYLFIEVHPEEIRRYGYAVRDLVELLTASYELEFWIFEHNRAKSKLGRSLAKCRSPKASRYSSVAEMLRATDTEPRPSQIYCVGRPK